MRRFGVLALLLAAVAAPVPPAARGAVICRQEITGTVSAADQNAYLLHRFQVPGGVAEVRVEAVVTQPSGARDPVRYVLDLGVREPAPVLGAGRLRSWNHNPAVIRTDDRGTPSSVPGPLPEGEWVVELGVAATVPGFPATYTVRVACTSDPDPPLGPPFAKPPFDPAAALRRGPRWFAGDLHVHSIYSSDATATADEIVAEARRRGLDFVARSDHNTPAHWLWLGEEQARAASDPPVLFLRSREVTTYFGHFNTHGAEVLPDYRTGPLYDADAGRVLVRGPLDPNALFDQVHAAGGLVQVNHPAFPPDPLAPFVCRGCGWDYPQADWSKVDLLEIQTGPPGKSPNSSGVTPDLPPPAGTTEVGGNPFTPQAMALWERQLAAGHLVGAVGGSDDHRAGRAGEGLTAAFLGQPTTVVYAEELSERAIVEGLRRRHAYVKLWGPGDPDVELEAVGLYDPAEAGMMGDVLHTAAANVTARVRRGAGTVLQLVLNGAVVLSVPVPGDEFALQVPVPGPGWVRVQVADATRPWITVSNPIFLRP